MLNLIIAEVVLDGWNALLKYLAMLVVSIAEIYPAVQRRSGSEQDLNLTLRLNTLDVALFKLIFEDRFTVFENRIGGFHRRFI